MKGFLMELQSDVTDAETAGGLLRTGHIVFSVPPQCYLSMWAGLSLLYYGGWVIRINIPKELCRIL